MAIIRIGSQRRYLSAGGGAAVARPVGPVGAQAISDGGGLAARVGRAAVEGAGEVMKLVARGYREAQTERVDDEALRVEEEFAKFRSEWTSANRGKLGENAADVFTAKHEELARAAMERLEPEGDEVYRGMLEKRLARQQLACLKDGLDYQAREKAAWQQSQWEGQLAAFGRMAEERPEDLEALQFKAAGLVESWKAKNPGKDPAAVIQQLGDLASERRVETLIAQGRLDEAQVALAEGLGRRLGPGLGAGAAGKAPAGGEAAAPSRGGASIAERLSNPLNLKKVGHAGGAVSDYQAFDSDAEGFAAAWRQLRIYQNGKRKLSTPAEMIRTWAPASDGNDLEKYFRVVASHGVDLNRPININDPDEAAALIKGMAVMESPLGRKYSAAQIAAMLKGGEAGGNGRPASGAGAAEGTGAAEAAGPGTAEGPGAGVGRKVLGLSPLKAARYGLRIEELRRRQESEAALRYKAPLDDFFAKCRAGVVVPPPFEDGELMAAFGEKGAELVERLHAEANFAIDAAAIRSMRPQEQEELLEMRRPLPDDSGYQEKLDRFQRLGRVIEADAKAREKDPMAYLMADNPAIVEAGEAFLQNFTAEAFQAYVSETQIAAHSRGLDPAASGQLFTRGMAQAIADQMAASPNPAQAFRQLREATGDLFVQAAAQIQPKLGLNSQIYASGMPDKAVAMIMDARRNPKFMQDAEALLGLAGPDRQLFDEALAEETEEIAATFAAAGNEEMPAALRENVRILAMKYMMGSQLKAEEAIRRAASEVITDRYEIGTSPSGAPYRIPKGLDMDAGDFESRLEKFFVKMNLDDVKLNIGPGVNERYRRRALRSMLMSNATIVTSEDESGFYVFNNSLPLTDSKDRPLKFSWEEVWGKD